MKGRYVIRASMKGTTAYALVDGGEVVALSVGSDAYMDTFYYRDWRSKLLSMWFHGRTVTEREARQSVLGYDHTTGELYVAVDAPMTIPEYVGGKDGGYYLVAYYPGANSSVARDEYDCNTWTIVTADNMEEAVKKAAEREPESLVAAVGFIGNSLDNLYVATGE